VLDPIEQFCSAIRAAGLTPPDEIIADDKLHRFSSNGKRGDDAGRYVFHANGIPAGWFGDWRTGLSQPWRADIGRVLTLGEEAAHRANMNAMRGEREADEARQRETSKTKAAAIWKTAPTAPDDHPYLTRKGVKAHGTRLHNGALAIPLWDGGELHSVQFIGADGEKRFLTGGRVKGCYFGIGNHDDAEVLCVVEGFATGASIHEATGYPVAVAFNAGNLMAIAKAFRGRFPDLRLIVCADDDSTTEGNPGLTKATEAALSIGGLLAVPDFGSNRPDGASDFNDMAAQCGLEAVKHAIAGSTAPAKTEHQAGAKDAAASDSAGHISYRCVSDILAKPIRWLWQGRIARGKVSMLAGNPGLGKSQVTTSMATIVTTGGTWPVDRTRCERGAVVFLSAEDDPEDTIRPDRKSVV
jgi:putative DNA primase/helicase